MKQELKESSVSELTVRQAVFNLKTKQLNWEIAAPPVKSKIALHFFVKDGKGTRYVNSVLVPTKGGSVNGIINATNSYEWLNRFASYENLYVLAEFTSSDEFKKRQPKFDAEKATSVLLYLGE